MNLNTVFKDYLTARKMFYTQERREVLRAVEESKSWFKMEDILAMANSQGMNLAKSTVYRNLQLMCAAGIVELKHHNGKRIYQRHITGVPVYRIQCRSCDCEKNIDDPILWQFITDWCQSRGYQTDGLVVKIDVVGKCQDTHGGE